MCVHTCTFPKITFLEICEGDMICRYQTLPDQTNAFYNDELQNCFTK